MGGMKPRWTDRIDWEMVCATLFAIVFIPSCFPALLAMWFGNFVSDRLRSRWPDSQRARQWAYWLRMLIPVAILLLLMASVYFGTAYLRALIKARR